MMQDGMTAPMTIVPMVIASTLLLAVSMAAIAWLVRSLARQRRGDQDGAVEVLGMRYARGEIDRDEYLRRRDDLRGRA